MVIPLVLDWSLKDRYGLVLNQRPPFFGGILLLMLFLFLGRLAPARLSPGAAVAFGLMTAGVMSNGADTLFHGGARDYIGWGPWLTNLADVYIWIGLIVIILVIKRASRGQTQED